MIELIATLHPVAQVFALIGMTVCGVMLVGGFMFFLITIVMDR